MVGVARHDEPRNGRAVASAGGENFFLQRPERAAFCRTGVTGKGALWAIVAQAGSLAPGDNKGGHSARAEGGLSGIAGGGPFGRVATVGRVPHVGGRVGGRKKPAVFVRSVGEVGDEAVQLGEVNFAEFGRENSACSVSFRVSKCAKTWP